MEEEVKESKPAPWWSTLLVTIVNAAVTVLVNHYVGPVAGVGAAAAGTAVAHVMQSPRQPK